jgi:DNA-binding NarL/FixJ family response regulator
MREGARLISVSDSGAPFSVLAVDDAELIRNHVGQLIDQHPRLRLRGIAADGIEALRTVRIEAPDVLLLDVFMTPMDGAEVLKTLREEGRRIPVVVLTARPTADLHAVVSQEPDAILFKEWISERELCEELVAAARNQDSKGRRTQYTAAAIAACRPRLNERELMVLRRLAEGMQVQQIAMDLHGIATRTVELHLHTIREKLEASTNAAAVALAYEVGLLGGRGDCPSASRRAA